MPKLTLRIFPRVAGLITLGCLVLTSPSLRAESPEILVHGHFKRMMHKGDTTAKVQLNSLSTAPGTWGVGALAGLQGEIVQVDGRLLVSPGTAAEGKVRPPEPADAATLWASMQVREWTRVSIPRDLSLAELEAFAAEQAKAVGLNPEQPFALRVVGQFTDLVWHVVTGDQAAAGKGNAQPAGHSGHSGHSGHGAHANKRAHMAVYRSPDTAGQLIGISSGQALEGVVSHPGERLHLHYLSTNETQSGHLDAVVVKAGASLLLPKAQAAEAVFTPKAEQVTGNVYAIVGPLGQRSKANAGLNANYGFVVGATGVILIDSGASAYSAAQLEAAVRVVTDKPVKWVLNTGSQDHRWLGNGYFSSRGAEIHALSGTVRTQKDSATQQIASLKRFVGEQMEGTQPVVASVVHPAPEQQLTLDGIRIQWIETGAHYPGDTMIHLPEVGVAFTGDLVYVDRILGVLPMSSVRNGQKAFQRLESLKPSRVAPGHGRVTDLAQARRETGDYYDFLVSQVGEAAQNMEPIGATLDRYSKVPAFEHLQNYGELHRANMNRAFVDFEANP